MKIKTRILLSYLLVFGTGFYFLVYWVLGDLRLRYLESVEEVLVDQSQLWAELAGQLMSDGALDVDWLHRVYDAAYARELAADIYGFRKTAVDSGLYITDPKGRVIFDALQRANEGADFSQWRDVYLTLRGEYRRRRSRHLAPDRAVVGAIGESREPGPFNLVFVDQVRLQTAQ